MEIVRVIVVLFLLFVFYKVFVDKSARQFILDNRYFSLDIQGKKGFDEVFKFGNPDTIKAQAKCQVVLGKFDVKTHTCDITRSNIEKGKEIYCKEVMFGTYIKSGTKELCKINPPRDPVPVKPKTNSNTEGN